jgi:C1A family cysteine protease
MGLARKFKKGWSPSLPNHRAKKYSVPRHVSAVPLPQSVDLRPGCPMVYDQMDIGSCTANALAAAVEFDRKKQGLPDWVPSRLFIYYNERSMEGTIQSDSGAQIADGIMSINTVGVCQEATWPYVESQFATAPPQAAYVEANQHESVSFEQVDQTLAGLQGCLAEGYPVVFGFSVYDAFESDQVAQTGVLNLPAPTEQCQGGHAVLIVGYDNPSQRFTVRNSWGADWGQSGVFSMPYAYVLSPDLASDFWTIRLMKS